MQNEIIYTMFFLAFLLVLAVLFFRFKPESVRTKANKKEEIINRYKKELEKALTPLKNDKNLRVAKKTELLKKFSDELAMNIFFDATESKNIILGFARDY